MGWCGDNSIHVEGLRGAGLGDLSNNRFKDGGVGGVRNVQVEDFSGIGFATARFYMNPHDKSDPAPNHTTVWANVGRAIENAEQAFNEAWDEIFQSESGCKGDTATAVWKNVNSSLNVPESIATDAGRMSIIVDAYSRGITQAREQLLSQEENYDRSARSTPSGDLQHYDEFARAVLESVYGKTIETVATNHPDTGRYRSPDIAPGAPPPTTATPSSPSGTGGGGPTSPGAPGMPASPKLPTVPASKLKEKPGLDPSAQSLGGVTQGVGDAVNAAGAAAKDAAENAADAAKQALGALGSQMNDGSGVSPSGVLGVSPIGLGKASGSAGGAPRAGGIGSGGGSPLPKAAANSAVGTSPTKAAGSAPLSRASVSAQGSPGMAGAPAAGNRGGVSAGAVHKVSKALNTRKNGTGLVGQSEAVLPVIGEVSAPDSPSVPTRS